MFPFLSFLLFTDFVHFPSFLLCYLALPYFWNLRWIFLEKFECNMTFSSIPVLSSNWSSLLMILFPWICVFLGVLTSHFLFFPQVSTSLSNFFPLSLMFLPILLTLLSMLMNFLFGPWVKFNFFFSFLSFSDYSPNKVWNLLHNFIYFCILEFNGCGVVALWRGLAFIMFLIFVLCLILSLAQLPLKGSIPSMIREERTDSIPIMT